MAGQGRRDGSNGAALDLADNWLNLSRLELQVYTDNAAGMAFRFPKVSSSYTPRSPQNTPLTSGVPVPSSRTTTRTETQTGRPHKGFAAYRSVEANGKGFEDLAWGYPEPIPTVEGIRDHPCFFDKEANPKVGGTMRPKSKTRFA